MANTVNTNNYIVETRAFPRFKITLSRETLDFKLFKPENSTDKDLENAAIAMAHQWSDKRVLISRPDSDVLESLPIPVRMSFGNRIFVVNSNAIDFDQELEEFLNKLEEIAENDHLSATIDIGSSGFDFIW